MPTIFRRAVSTSEIVLTIGIVVVTLGTGARVWRGVSTAAGGQSATGSSASSLEAEEEKPTATGTCLDRFTLADGTIRLTASGSVAVYVLGSEIRYGATTVPATLSASIDGGMWRPLLSGKSLRGRRGAATQADAQTLASLGSGATVAFRVQATDGSMYARSETSDGTRLLLLRNGDRLPGGEALAGDLGEYASGGRARIGAHDVLLVTYLNNTNATNADWRHASVLVHVGQPAGVCDQPATNGPRAMVEFERREERGGNPEYLVHVGPAGTPRDGGAWIALTENDEPVHDAGLVGGAGISLQRQGTAQAIKVTHAGSGRSPAIADLRVTLAGATITSVKAGSAATGDLHDGLSNDAPAGDEAVIAADRRSVLLMSRAGSAADAFVIEWRAD